MSSLLEIAESATRFPKKELKDYRYLLFWDRDLFWKKLQDNVQYEDFKSILTWCLRKTPLKLYEKGFSMVDLTVVQFLLELLRDLGLDHETYLDLYKLAITKKRDVIPDSEREAENLKFNQERKEKLEECLDKVVVTILSEELDKEEMIMRARILSIIQQSISS